MDLSDTLLQVEGSLVHFTLLLLIHAGGNVLDLSKKKERPVVHDLPVSSTGRSIAISIHISLSNVAIF